MVNLAFDLTVILGSLQYRSYAQLFAGSQDGHPFHTDTKTGGGADFLFQFLIIVGFFLTHFLDFLHYQVSSSPSRHRSWTSRSTSQVLAEGTRANRGPKSPAKARILLIAGGFLLIFIEHYMTTLNPDAVPWRPEGSGPATRFGGATQFLALHHPSMAKPSGLGPTSEHLEHQHPQHRKKSYIRALKRAHLHGHTWYRGQLLTAAMMGIEETSQLMPTKTSSSSLAPNIHPPAKVRKNRLTGFCWNICSLSNYKFDILRQWMLSQHLDIMILQDTRWGFSGDWSDNNYAYIHSGSTGKTGGTMTIIKKGFCNIDMISWRAVVPGRLLHVRLYLPSSGIDIINAYQDAWIQNDPTCLQHRRELLHACNQLVAGLPQRNVVILGGDLNTSLHRTPHCVGLSDFQDDKGRRSGPRHPDSNLLGDLLLQHGLTAINTWDTKLGPTYTGGHSNKSRIDCLGQT